MYPVGTWKMLPIRMFKHAVKCHYVNLLFLRFKIIFLQTFLNFLHLFNFWSLVVILMFSHLELFCIKSILSKKYNEVKNHKNNAWAAKLYTSSFDTTHSSMIIIKYEAFFSGSDDIKCVNNFELQYLFGRFFSSR